MMLILYSLFLSLYHYLVLANEQLINNPVGPQNNLKNIVNYAIRLNSINIKNNEIIEYKGISLKQNLKNIYYQSYISDMDFFIFSNSSGQDFLLLEKKYYCMTKENEKYHFKKKKIYSQILNILVI